MTRLSSFLSRCLASNFSGLASGVRRPASSSGFSLIEVMLALMVMAIGILSIIGLFCAGLDQNTRSIADTRAAFFAGEVLDGLRACAETNWDGLADVQLSAAGWPDMINGTSANVITNSYMYEGFEDHVLRYRLVVTNAGPNSLLKAATLWVWPGKFGATNDPGMFYAEFFKFRP